MATKIRYTCGVIMVLLMITVADITREYEIIFPEIAALVLGGWIAGKHPWRVNKIQFILFMCLASILGIVMVRIEIIPLIAKILISFAICGVVLILCRSTMLPIISACILPILMGTESIIYPISVTVMVIIIVLVQNLFEKCNLRDEHIFMRNKSAMKLEAIRWGMLFITVLILSIIAIKFNYIFLIAPPLIVCFAEFSYIHSNVRKKPLNTYGLIVLCSAAGALSKYLFYYMLNLPLIVSGIVIVLILFCIYYKTKMIFPPSGALALLPLIINNSDSMLSYPIQVAIGGGTMIIAAMMIGNILKKYSHENHIKTM